MCGIFATVSDPLCLWCAACAIARNGCLLSTSQSSYFIGHGRPCSGWSFTWGKQCLVFVQLRLAWVPGQSKKACQPAAGFSPPFQLCSESKQVLVYYLQEEFRLPTALQPDQPSGLSFVRPQGWDTHCETWSTHSSGWRSTSIIYLFLCVPCQGRRPWPAHFSYLHTQFHVYLSSSFGFTGVFLLVSS